MNDQSIMSLFDSDTNLLDEITGLNTGLLGQDLGTGDQGILPQTEPLMAVSQHQPQHLQQQQQAQAFLPMQNAALPHQNLNQGIHPTQQQRLHHLDEFSFSSSTATAPQKLHHLPDQGYMQNINTGMNNTSPPIEQPPPPQYQPTNEPFSQTFQGNQKAVINDFNPMWSQTQQNTNQMNQSNAQQFIQDQNNPECQVPPPYLTHHGHDYALPPNRGQGPPPPAPQQRQQPVQAVQVPPPPPPQQQQRYLPCSEANNQGNGYLQAQTQHPRVGQPAVNTRANLPNQAFPSPTHSQGMQINTTRLPAQIQPSAQPAAYQIMQSGGTRLPTQRPAQQTINQPPTSQTVVTYNVQSNMVLPNVQLPRQPVNVNSVSINKGGVQTFQQFPAGQRPAVLQGENSNQQRMTHFSANPNPLQCQPEPQFMQNFTPTSTNLQRSMVPHSMHPSTSSPSMPPTNTITSQGNFAVNSNIVPPPVSNNTTETLGNPFDMPMSGGPIGQPNSMQQPSASSTYSTPGYTVPATTTTNPSTTVNMNTPRTTATISGITVNIQGQTQQFQIKTIPNQPNVQQTIIAPAAQDKFVPLAPAQPKPAPQPPAFPETVSEKEKAKIMKQRQAQEKANRICAEAMLKAQAQGIQSVSSVVVNAAVEPASPQVKEEPKKAKPKEKTEKPPKAKKNSTPRKKPAKKPNISLLNIKNKKLPSMKRKGDDTGDSGSDLDETPPPSPEDSFALKRRSARNTKRKRYTEDYDYQISDEEDKDVDVEGLGGAPTGATFFQPAKFFIENPDESESFVVDKILSVRSRLKEQIPGEAQVGEVEEFLVKYKNFSYLHCEWATVEKLERDKRIHMKIKRFRQKQNQINIFLELDEEPFNPDYLEVDRVLEVTESEDPIVGTPVTHCLVKWRSQAYEDSTWELREDVDEGRIQEYRNHNVLPAVQDRKRVARPPRDSWEKFSESRGYKNGNTLREYQLEGVNWLTFSWYNRQNCILADEMGLGKTIQSISFLLEIQRSGIQGPFLIIAPLSTIANWQREFESWSDANCVVYHGSATSRRMIQEYEMYFRNDKGVPIPNLYKFQVLVTTYEIILADTEVLSQIEWRCAVIDEAHRLKNKNCKLLEGLKMLNLEHRVLLTGTPLQNNVEELFSLLNFLEPGHFCSLTDFLGEFGDLKTEGQVEKLQDILKPMMLRRLKEDVEKNLAPKEETIIEVELTNIQKKYYRAILERNFSFLSKGTGSSTNVPNLMNTMMELRKCCNHPFLINGAEEQIMYDFQDNSWNRQLQALIQSAGKMVLIDKLLPKLREGGHRVLVFSQMVRCLDILEDYLLQRRYPYERIDGRVRGNMRQAAIDRFSKPDSDRFVFLLCTRAGGLGINLTAADTVIIFDSDWNPQNDLQAQARCHRIGQVKAVKVYRLITRNSYEREMFDKASLKLGLDKAVLQSMRHDKDLTNNQPSMSKKEIEELLRKGAYGAIMDDDDASSKFCEEDIDHILKRRTQVIQIESEGKGSTFAKASFISSSDRQDISLDDPDFWQKWAKKADIDEDEIKSRDIGIINQPRQRKQTRRFGNLDEVLEFTSESESEEDEKKVSKKQLQSGWTRVECFRVEKGLLTFGWGRWEDIIRTGKFKRKLGEKDVEAVSRTILVYCLQYYKGDEKIKSFIWDLVTPATEGAAKIPKNHSGLSNPVPRGRKGKKAKKENKVVPALREYDFTSKTSNPEELLHDPGYKNHLKRHCNKVLLRVRMLYYLKQEIIGDLANKISLGTPATSLPLPVPCPEGDPPIGWWDDEADRSLMVGVYKHGYERYSLLRGDPALCFLDRCGPPDAASLRHEEIGDNDDDDVLDDEPDFKPVNKLIREDLEEDSMSPSSRSATPQPSPRPTKSTHKKVEPPTAPGKLPFPAASDLNTRLRRLVTSLQRNHKKQQLKQAARERKEAERKHRFEEALKQKELKKKEQAQRWSRREESDFYRTVSAFGVEFDPETRVYKWNNFRKIARLDKKTDEKLQEYYENFRAMCLRVCKRGRTRDGIEGGTDSEDQKDYNEEFLYSNTLNIEIISEERANKCLQRIDLLSQVRNEILAHPELDERLKLCRPSMELPEWWEPGAHDKDILLGVARYGINRAESQHHMMNDKELSFYKLKDKYEAMSVQSTPVPSSSNFPPPGSSGAENTDPSKPVNFGDKVEVKPESIGGTLDATTTSQTIKQESGTENISSVVKSEIKVEENMDDIDDDNDDLQIDIGEDESSVGENSNLSLLRQELTKPSMVTELLQDENSQDSFSMESSSQPTVAMLLNPHMPPIIRWPKDKVIIHRLEQIIYCVENNQWPVRRGFISQETSQSMDSSHLDMNVDSPTMPSLDAADFNLSGDLEAITRMSKETGGLKMTIQKKRKRRKKAEIEAERAKLAELLSGKPVMGLPQSDGNVSDDTCSSLPSLPDLPQLTKLPPLFCDTPPHDGIDNTVEGIANGTAAITPDMIGAGIIGIDKKLARKKKHAEEKKRKREKKEDGEKVHKRRKKKPKFDEMGRWTPSNLDDDDPVPVISESEGVRLCGLAAPLKKDLEKWLKDHPGYTVDYPPQPAPNTQLIHSHDKDILEEEGEKKEKKKRKRTPNPAKLDMSKITGEEKVTVINRTSGRKVTGKKAPTLLTLSEWLDKNPDFDVPAEWGPIVKEKCNLSAKQLNRIMPSASKGGTSLIQPATFLSSADNPLSLSSIPGMQASGLLGSFPSSKFPLNPGFPNVGMGQYGINPLLGFAGLGALSSFPVTSKESTTDNDEEKGDEERSTVNTNISAATSKAMPYLFPSTPGLFFSPFVANPGYINPAALAAAGLVNGTVAVNSEDSAKSSPTEEGQTDLDKDKGELELSLGDIDTSDIDDIEETLDNIPDDDDDDDDDLEDNEDDLDDGLRGEDGDTS